ncbi:Uma2 family endonuclease [Streptomyces sp. MUM 203J]|nr:Uma2 family endonuclease [Streptomyces sp. MUM 203J]MCH0538210.1 Uma2 family endonuclease [Streptomyces sp. MUM 203J]
MRIRLDEHNRPGPDVLVVPVDAGAGPGQTWVRPEGVVLAVEVVSEDSEERDREVEPRKYARAGVPHFGRVEENNGPPAVHVYELDPSARSYVPSGIFHDRLKVPVPFPLGIGLVAVNRRRPWRPQAPPGPAGSGPAG